MIQTAERSKAKREVLMKLALRLGSLGFDPNPSDQSFSRKAATGKCMFHVAFIPHKTDFDLTADVAVRIDAIEDLVNQYDTKLSSSEKRESMTLGVELGNLSRGRQLRWTVASVEDIPNVCDNIEKTFESVGLPFLQSHSDAATAFRVLSSSDPKDTLLSPLLGPRSMRAIASACLSNEPVDIAGLANRFEAKLVEKEDLYLDDYRALCRGLLLERAACHR